MRTLVVTTHVRRASVLAFMSGVCMFVGIVFYKANAFKYDVVETFLTSHWSAILNKIERKSWRFDQGPPLE